jgi:hypothetical protein
VLVRRGLSASYFRTRAASNVGWPSSGNDLLGCFDDGPIDSVATTAATAVRLRNRGALDPALRVDGAWQGQFSKEHEDE